MANGSSLNTVAQTDLEKNEESSLLELRCIRSEVTMWSQEVVGFSSQYGNELSISYTMSNLEGPSNIYSQYGDFTQAAVVRTYGRWWLTCPSAQKSFRRSRGNFISQDFVELSFGCACVPTNVEIFETYNPGAVVRLLACDQSKPKNLRWFILWEGQPQAQPHAARIFCPQPIRKCPFYTNLIRIEFHHSQLNYYAELDAVRVTGLLPSSVQRTDAAKHPLEGSLSHQEGHHHHHHRHHYLNGGMSLRITLTPSSMPSSSFSQVCLFPMSSFSSLFRKVFRHRQDVPEEQLASSSAEPVDPDDGPGSSVDRASGSEFPESDGPSGRQAPAPEEPSPEQIDVEGGEGNMETSSSHENEADDENDCDFFKLPLEILNMIFDYLDLKSLCSLSCTCQFFSKFCNGEMQYYELDLQPYWHQATDELLVAMTKRCSATRKADLSWCSHVTNMSLKNFLTECSLTLTCLRLNSCTFVDCESLRFVSSTCLSLQELRLQSCQKIHGSTFGCLSSLRELRILDLYRTLVNTESLVKIIRSCEKLEQVNFGSCTNNTDCDRVVCELARCCPNLRTVDFWRSRGLMRHGLAEMVRGCPLLEELDLGWCNELKSNDGCFKEIADNCPNLKKLFVTANRSVCDSDVEVLSRKCTRLQQLDILGTREITNLSVIRLLQRCNELVLLDLSFCAGIDYSALEPVLASYPRVDVKRSFQMSSQVEEYLDRPAQLQ